MPTSVAELFSRSSLLIRGQVKWGERISDERPGVYVVSISPNPNEVKNKFGTTPPIDRNLIQEWIKGVPTLTLNGTQPTSNELSKRLAGFWLPDEPILYIGKAGTSLNRRVGQYYRTPLGANKPHAGGHWLKTLSILEELYIYWGITIKANASEDNLLNIFVGNVSNETRQILLDQDNPFPFANLEHPKGNRKNHCIKGSVNR